MIRNFTLEREFLKVPARGFACGLSLAKLYIIFAERTGDT